LTHCLDVVERAKASGKPVRILYISDFDPAGMSMPVAVARKVEFEVYKSGPDLDVHVIPIALTHEQCVEYRLPRTPLKDDIKGGAKFEERFGEGATELDALNELYPGALGQIIEREIGRYYDAELGTRIQEAADDIKADIREIHKSVYDEHREEIDALESEWDDIATAAGELREEFEAKLDELQSSIDEWSERANPVYRAIQDSLNAQAPDLDAVIWPEPTEGDEFPDPLYDSARDYVEQVDRYKEHQAKPTERKTRNDKGKKMKRKEAEQRGDAS
jgi:hypothetical protein